MWLNLAIAALLLTATIVGFYLAHRVLRGDGLPQLRRAPREEPTGHVEDIEQIIANYRREKGDATLQIATTLQAPARPRPATQPAAAPATVVRPRPSLLSGPNKLLYLVLKAALPDHQIFVNVRLVDAVQITGQPPTPHARAQLAQARVDFVICNKQLAVVAMIDITDGNRADAVLKRQIEPQITAAGSRYLRIAPTAIPKPGDARNLVCGTPG